MSLYACVKTSKLLLSQTYRLRLKHRSMNTFTNWVNQWFNGVRHACPVFLMSGERIKVLSKPEEFYKELMKRSAQAQRRITLASLYLGNGSLEENLVQAILENVQTSKNAPEINILLEYTRGSRGRKNSRTLLLPLLKSAADTTHVTLFHTPNLRGVLKAIVPERFNETINVAHLKVYLFDDTLIMSGANLSNDYFTNRQDRYVVFENCKELCDYYEDLVKVISKFSFQLQQDDTVTTHKDFPFHPYKSSKRDFNREANKLLTAFVAKYAKKIYTNNAVESGDVKSERAQIESESTLAKCVDVFSKKNSASKESLDTVVFPLLQMRTMGIDQDEKVTTNILAYAPENTDLVLATAYFNLTDGYWNAILRSKPYIDLIMAHPKAMGFYKAAGMAGGVPNAYSLISKRRYKDLAKNEATDRVRFLEFHRPSWTFHGKGLWAFLKGKNDLVSSPLLTLIGSPNFGKRSVFRDMESQVGIVTTNENLQKSLLQERDRMRDDAVQVTMATYNEKEREIKWWVYLIATFMNEMF